MIEPTGPLSSTVYWRRRLAAIGAGLVTLLLVIWIVGMFGSDAETAQPTNAAASASNPPPSMSESPAPASSSSTTQPTPPPSPTETTPPPPPPGPPQPCPDDVIGVLAKANKPFYTIGDQPELSMDVVNTGPVPCIRDIGRQHRELTVLTADGATVLWSSNHCLSAVGSETRVMQPKEIFNYGTKWAGSTSKPGCGAHTRVGPGDYLLVAKLAGKASSPTVFRLEH
ncbi:hypothetical protein [Lentzea flaviverrucosa]|uniref:Uncharacterized protein n=1 Tax=Lentzea flaviverrucosa TaxID=200379 RepID=A0A1H9X5K9_9PSEU|nr:hypothetical protein [Lentzea flaviverrucosa]RDI20847.1 hypothetical protein DFR72_11465 [Lentzea flaviverrucosa]SES41147.1 hypothetical protein SAMN05216195_113223 [Lentzea flaviverrucosa]